jgi:hypothetical protein
MQHLLDGIKKIQVPIGLQCSQEQLQQFIQIGTQTLLNVTKAKLPL